MASTTTPDLPSDIIFEVLTRTDTQTLGMCRMVCNDWNSMTYDSSFTQLHTERANSISGYFVQTLSHNTYKSDFFSYDDNSYYDSPSVVSLSLDFLPKSAEILASSNQGGLLFCVSQTPQSTRNLYVHQYYVCKPSTKQWRTLPNPKTRYFTQSCAIMVLRLKPLHYKIVRFSRPKHREPSRDYYYSYFYRCEVFDSEAWKWTTLPEIKLAESEFLNRREGAVSANGSIHWTTTMDRVLTFDVNEESWSLSTTPLLFEKCDHRHRQLVEYGGHVALVCMNKEAKEIVLLGMEEDENGEKIWKKKQTMDIEAFMKKEPWGIFPKAFLDVDTGFTTVYNEAVFYKFKDSSFNVGKLSDPASHVFSYKSDYEPI